MPDQNHPQKVPGLVSGAQPNADHPNTQTFEPTEFQQGKPETGTQPEGGE